MIKGFGLQWHITDKCDQRCKHCYIYHGKNEKHLNEELPLCTLEEILNDFIECCDKMSRTPSIAITGGDPLLHSNAREFFGLLRSKNLKFSILGNPFHLSTDAAIKLKEMGCINYQMSLDGPREIHDYIRKPGSFDITLEKIKCLNNIGLQSTIMATVSKINIDKIPELVDIVVTNNVRNFAFARYCPNPDDIEAMVTAEEYKDLLEKLWDIFSKYKDCNTLFSLKDHLWTLFLFENGLFTIPEDEDIIFDGCHCGISHLNILADGTVYACRRFESPIGKVPDQSIYDIFNGKEIEQYRDYEKFKKCANCELIRFCRGCPAVAFCSTGNFYDKDPQCWKSV